MKDISRIDRVQSVLNLSLTILLLSGGCGFSQTGRVLFYVGFEGNVDGLGRDCIHANVFTSKGGPLTIFSYEPGVIGRAARFTWTSGYPGIQYPAEGNYDPDKGTISLWVRKTDPFFINRYYPHIWGIAGPQIENALALAPLNDEKKMIALDDNKRHHCVYTWDISMRKRCQYLDGEELAQGEYQGPCKLTELIFGYRLTGSMDELVILDRALSLGEVNKIYQDYRQGRNPFVPPQPTRRDYPQYPLDISSLPDIRPNLPASIDWSLKPALDNGRRARYELSGLWRFQPVALEWQELLEKEVSNPGYYGEVWAYATVPGNWRSTQPSVVSDAFGQPMTRCQDGRPITDYRSAWYERDFALPVCHRESRVFLVFPRTVGSCEVYLNGKHVGSIVAPEQQTRFQISANLLWDRSNRLTIQNGIPFVPSMEVGGLVASPFLEVRASTEIDLGRPLINPSIRKKVLNVAIPMENLSAKALDLSVTARILDYSSDKAVKICGPVELKIDKGAQNERTISFPAEGLPFWSPEAPNLLRLVLEVRDGKRLMDITFPESFGYREVWVEGGDILMNGHRLSVRGKSHGYLGGYGFRADEIFLLKATGQNADCAYSSGPQWEDTLQVTDEQGWLVFYSIGAADPKMIQGILRRVGNHPSVISWHVKGNGYINGPHGHPMQISGKVPDDIQASDPSYQAMRKLAEADPYHLNAYFRLGTGGQFRSIMHYMGFGTPIQTMEEWPSYCWAKMRPEPLLPLEISLVLDREFSLWQIGSGSACLAEQSARYFGEEAYRKLDKQMMKAYSPRASNDEVVQTFLTSALNYDLKDFVYTPALRSWRTYGIAGYLIHVAAKTMHTHQDAKLTRWGQALAKVNSPLLFYIGDSKDDFVSKNHAFFSGELMQKSAIIVNDTFQERELDILWNILNEKGETLAKEQKKISVSPGAICFVPITHKCQEVRQIARQKICAVCKDMSGKELLQDEFAFEVFPASDFRWDRKPVLLIDAIGDTRKTLASMNIPFQEISIAAIDEGLGLDAIRGHDLLIIGRNSCRLAADILKGWLPLDKTIENGMNVVCLEQMNRQVMGLKLENFNSREVFIRAGDCPLFDRLTDADFRNWRGQSSMLPPYLPWHQATTISLDDDLAHKHGQENSFGQKRFWQWSNKGMVASFSFEKPQGGNFKVLLDNGFDLLYTPLIEFRFGQGRVLFNQLDLVDHCQVDPVARLLLCRILREYAQRSDLGLLPVACPGGKESAEVLRRVGFEYVDDLKGNVAFISPGDLETITQDQHKKLMEFISNGGTLLTRITNAEGAAKLPVRVNVDEKELFNPKLPATPEFDGLGGADTFWREITPLLAITAIDEKNISPAIGAVIPYGKGKIVLLQIPPDKYDGAETAWPRSKVLRIYATVLTNLKGKSNVKIDLKAVAGLGEPEEWLAGYGKAEYPRPLQLDGRLYPVQALSFDPDEHHVW